jgi:hypothetical protein
MQSLYSHKWIAVGLIAVIGTSLVFVTTQAQNNANAAASADSTATTTPIYSKSEIMTAAKQIISEKKISADSNIDLQVDVKSDAVSFVAVNNGDKAVDLKVTKWMSQIRSVDYDYQFPIEKDLVDAKTHSGIIEARQSVVVKKFDLTKYGDFFETYPGTYIFDVQGMRWSDEMQGNDVAYRLAAKVTFGYDDAKILSNPNKLLKAEGMQVLIEGDGEAFTFEGDSVKQISFYLYNDQNTKISSMIKGYDFLIWNTDDRIKADGGRAIRETLDAECTYLEPGERLLVTTYNFSTSEWPFGAKGIAKQYGIDTKLPGLYIADMEVYTLPCTLENGENVSGGERSLTAAFEVKP